jgi:CCR4-NOT transcription complex subunit 2
VPSIQQPSNQRASQAPGLAPQAASTPGGFLPRSQSGFAFSAGGISPATVGQHQPSTPGGLQPQTNGTPGLGSMPPHLSPSSNLSGNGAQSVSSASEVGLDPNDFPALGSAPATNSNANNNGNNTHTSSANGGNPSGSSQVATSYASQAGTGGSGVVGGGASATGGTTGSSSQPREFTPDDFPALGNHPQDHSHPPGLNGFEHRPNVNVNVLGSLGGANTTPGMLHLGGAQQQGRNVHPGFGQGLSEAEKAQQRVSHSSDNR